jgi:SAM-dependent methyltransferase
MNELRRDPATDRARLVGAAYATPAPLAARAALYAYERDPVDFGAWVLDHVEAECALTATSRVVDVGCGPGHYLDALRRRHPGIATVGLDISPGMAAATLVAPALTVVGFDRLRREIVVTDPAPIVAYIESMESLYEPVVPTGTSWVDVLDVVESRVTAIIERQGAFTVNSDAGVLLCRAR